MIDAGLCALSLSMRLIHCLAEIPRPAISGANCKQCFGNELLSAGPVVRHDDRTLSHCRKAYELAGGAIGASFMAEDESLPLTLHPKPESLASCFLVVMSDLTGEHFLD